MALRFLSPLAGLPDQVLEMLLALAHGRQVALLRISRVVLTTDPSLLLLSPLGSPGSGLLQGAGPQGRAGVEGAGWVQAITRYDRAVALNLFQCLSNLSSD